MPQKHRLPPGTKLAGPTVALRLASYNIHKCVGLDGKRLPERIVDVVNALQADIVALQEVDRRYAPRPAALPPRLLQAATHLVPLDLAPEGPSLGFHGQTILLHPRVMVQPPVLHRLDLPGLEPRGAVFADLTVAGGRVRIVCVHLGLLRTSRMQQMEAIMGRLEALEPLPTAILGDFNEWSTRSGTEPLNGPFRVHVPGRSYPAGRPVAALDRIALSAGMHLLDAGTLSTPISRRASDHLPVWADVRAELPRRDTSWPEARISGAGLSSGPAQP
jgi:endonuclease/exonuclease/phosphatase family metal-dependent hydrolase